MIRIQTKKGRMNTFQMLKRLISMRELIQEKIISQMLKGQGLHHKSIQNCKINYKREANQKLRMSKSKTKYL